MARFKEDVLRPDRLIRWLVIAVAIGAARARADERPNIVFLLADDFRWDAVGALGNPVIHTPNLDRLVRSGVTFPNAFVTTSICSISRASILTGQYESRHGIKDFQTRLSPAALAATFPALLRRAGYHAGFIGKWGVGAAPLPEDQFDYWRGFPGQGNYFSPGSPVHLTDRMGDQAIEFLSTSPPDRPFLLALSFKAPHEEDGKTERPFPPAARFETLYADLAIAPLPGAAERFERLPDFLKVSEARARWRRCFGDPELYARTVKDYYRLITGLDEVVGRIRTQLDRQKVADRTVIVFTSDNGFALGDRGLQGKWFPYEESIRVPLILSDPRLPPSRQGTSAKGMVLNIDLAPTILELAALPVPPALQGESLLPWTRGEVAAWRTDWFYEHHFVHPGLPQSEAVRGERWKYIRYLDRAPVVEQLFDLERDPFEATDLAAHPSHQTRLNDLRQRWDHLRALAR